MQETGISPDESLSRQLKLAMRGLASSVTILSTVDAQGRRNAMTATSTTALTMEPPAMLVCVNRATSFFATLSEGADFAINILAADQAPLATLCASGAKGEDRFACGGWREDDRRIPYLADAQAAILCAQDGQMRYGTHAIVIGRVRAVHLPRAIDPLVYADGGYRVLGG